MHTRTLSALVALSLFVIAPAAAPAKDVTLRQKVTQSGVHVDTHESMQYWTGSSMVTDAPDVRVIIDLDAETMTMADKRQKTYFTQTFAEMRQRADAMKAEMQKRLEQMPPQAREMMGKMGMGAMGADTPVSVKPTGKSEKIAGYDAKEYAIDAGPMSGSIWATDALQPPGGAKTGEALGKMTGAAGPGANFAQAMAQIKGVPLRTTMRSGMGGQGFSTTTETVEVSEKAPPADVLKVPDGFKKVAAPAFDRMPPGKRPGAP